MTETGRKSKAVAFDSLPSAVKEDLKAKAGASKIMTVESITKHDKIVAYQATVQTGGKKKDFRWDLTAKPLDHEE